MCDGPYYHLGAVFVSETVIAVVKLSSYFAF